MPKETRNSRALTFKGPQRKYVRFLETRVLLCKQHHGANGFLQFETVPTDPSDSTDPTPAEQLQERVDALIARLTSGAGAAWEESLADDKRDWMHRQILSECDSTAWQPLQTSPLDTVNNNNNDDNELQQLQTYSADIKSLAEDQTLIKKVKNIKDYLFVTWSIVIQKRHSGSQYRDDDDLTVIDRVDELIMDRFGLLTRDSAKKYRYACQFIHDVNSLILETIGDSSSCFDDIFNHIDFPIRSYYIFGRKRADAIPLVKDALSDAFREDNHHDPLRVWIRECRQSHFSVISDLKRLTGNKYSIAKLCKYLGYSTKAAERLQQNLTLPPSDPGRRTSSPPSSAEPTPRPLAFGNLLNNNDIILPDFAVEDERLDPALTSYERDGDSTTTGPCSLVTSHERDGDSTTTELCSLALDPQCLSHGDPGEGSSSNTLLLPLTSVVQDNGFDVAPDGLSSSSIHPESTASLANLDAGAEARRASDPGPPQPLPAQSQAAGPDPGGSVEQQEFFVLNPTILIDLLHSYQAEIRGAIMFTHWESGLSFVTFTVMENFSARAQELAVPERHCPSFDTLPPRSKLGCITSPSTSTSTSISPPCHTIHLRAHTRALHIAQVAARHSVIGRDRAIEMPPVASTAILPHPRHSSEPHHSRCILFTVLMANYSKYSQNYSRHRPTTSPTSYSTTDLARYGYLKFQTFRSLLSGSRQRLLRHPSSAVAIFSTISKVVCE